MSSQQRRWVVKIGSSLLTNHGQGIAKEAIAGWVAQIVALKEQGIDVVIVSSGAVAEGMARLGWTQRPHALNELQAAAAIGQMGLVQVYESYFQAHDIHTAQILLTHDDLSDRERYLNARSAIRKLLELDAVPIVNENDTVVTDEIKFGDNDTLAALVANLIEADLLVILTDQPGMYTADPSQDPNAVLIEKAEAGDLALEKMAGKGKPGQLGRGGMLTKIKAAALASRSGADTVIAAGQSEQILARIARGDENIGTWLVANQAPLVARKRWLAGHLQMKGRIYLDQGAVDMLVSSGSSLLSVGVTEVVGDFIRGDAVLCLGPDGREVGRGLINYDAEEARLIMGHPSEDIEILLGYVDELELIHRDNLVLS